MIILQLVAIGVSNKMLCITSFSNSEASVRLSLTISNFKIMKRSN